MSVCSLTGDAKQMHGPASIDIILGIKCGRHGSYTSPPDSSKEALSLFGYVFTQRRSKNSIAGCIFKGEES